MNSANTAPSMTSLVESMLALFVGGTLGFAGLGHVTNPMFFLGSIVQYDLLPHTLAVLVSAVLPWVEILLAIMLLLRLERRTAFNVASILALGFVLAQASALYRGLEIDCGCFGALAEREIGSQSLALAMSLCIASTVGCFAVSQPGADPNTDERLAQRVLEGASDSNR